MKGNAKKEMKRKKWRACEKRMIQTDREIMREGEKVVQRGLRRTCREMRAQDVDKRKRNMGEGVE